MHRPHELDCRLLIEAVVETEDTQPRAVIDRRELVIATLARPLQRRDELDVDLHSVAWLGLLVALPAITMAFVALRARQKVHVEAFEDPPDPRHRHRDVVVTPEVHLDLLRPEVIVRAQIDDLGDDLTRRRPRAHVWTLGAVSQAI
jgi:hypothetical protein